MSMCACEDWAACFALQDVWVSRCKRVMNDAGDLEYEDCEKLNAYVEAMKGRTSDDSGRTNMDRYMLVTGFELCVGDRVWLDCPDRCKARTVETVEKLFDPMCKQIHHYEVVV